MSMKNPLTPAGIEPVIFPFVAQQNRGGESSDILNTSKDMKFSKPFLLSGILNDF